MPVLSRFLPAAVGCGSWSPGENLTLKRSRSASGPQHSSDQIGSDRATVLFSHTHTQILTESHQLKRYRLPEILLNQLHWVSFTVITESIPLNQFYWVKFIVTNFIKSSKSFLLSQPQVNLNQFHLVDFTESNAVWINKQTNQLYDSVPFSEIISAESTLLTNQTNQLHQLAVINCIESTSSESAPLSRLYWDKFSVNQSINQLNESAPRNHLYGVNFRWTNK